MAKIGYARVSTLEQNKDLQINALKEVGCEKIFTDDISGAKTDRKGLNEAIAYMRPGDVFVVWKLDRAGRSLAHLIQILNTLIAQGSEFISLTEKIDTTTAGGKLIFHLMGALAEFERDLIRERTMAGLLAARARGRNGGRPRKIKNGKVAVARRMYEDKSNEIDDICETLGVSRSTLYRYVREGKQA
jgi:DNA invertase Pin-like site-specific DNA recombinase